MKSIKCFLIVLVYFLFSESCKFSHKVNYTSDIAPIIHTHCTSCHRPNQIGQFSLITYDDVKRNADKIAFVTQRKLMPPYPADVSYTHFVDENYLTDKEINIITKWVNEGCLQGDTSKVIHLPLYSPKSMYKTPDVVIPIKPQAIINNSTDQFLLVKVPFLLPYDTVIQSVEFVPGNRSVVHHVNGDLVRFDFDKKKNINDGSLSTPIVLDSTIALAYKKIGILHDDGTYPPLARNVFNYLPGVLPTHYPEGIGGWRVNKKSAFLLTDIHYGPSNKNTWDSSYINLFFKKSSSSARSIQEFQLGTLGISPIVPPLHIEPNKVSEFITQYTLPQKISVLTINPHMHLLGKSFWAYALTPNRDTIRLIKIPRWDFNWQYFYTYLHPVVIPAGSTIYAHGVYDNTSKNPFNPNHPPKLVTDKVGSMKTSDEMFQCIITYMVYQQGDEKITLLDK